MSYIFFIIPYMKKLVTKTQVLLLTSLIALVFSCKKQNPSPAPIPPKANVSWIESSNRKDTLVFVGGDTKLLSLNRGTEMRNGFLLPRIWGGLYTYSFKKDSIGLNYLLSSLYATQYYTYKIENDKLYIGDFFQKSTIPGQTLTFEKLK